MKFAAKPMRHYPPHLRHVATLPWEMFCSVSHRSVQCSRWFCVVYRWEWLQKAAVMISQVYQRAASATFNYRDESLNRWLKLVVCLWWQPRSSLNRHPLLTTSASHFRFTSRTIMSISFAFIKLTLLVRRQKYHFSNLQLLNIWETL